jgi:DNA mismatch repair protein MutL
LTDNRPESGASETRHVARMPEDLANQIAAGEVVERPASAVKELVENAIDAGARRIRIELEDGGLGLIRVADDGSGMTRADAELCIERHATSKLRHRDDLFDIRTLGFRGEALPSIASVSHFEMLTKPRGALGGTRVQIDGGAPARFSEAGCPPGTEIVVRDLFYNTPARLKFLRQRSTELKHVVEVVHRMALPRPDVGFVLVHNKRTILDLPAVIEPIERVRALFDAIDAPNLYALDPAQQDGVFCSGYFGQPALTRRTADSIFAFVNGRFIRDRAVMQAIKLGYEGMVDRGRHPVAIAFIDLPPHAVDVNVHPMKIEVRFHDSNAVFRAVRRAFLQSLAAAPWVGQGAGSPSARVHQTNAEGDREAPAPVEQQSLNVRSYTLHSRELPAPAQSPQGGSNGSGALASAGWSPRVSSAFEPTLSSARTLDLPRTSSGQSSGEQAPPRVGFFSGLHFIGSFKATYLIASDGDGLVVVDQHAAHERITFEALRQSWTARRAHAQPMLVPQVVRLDSIRAAVLEENLELFAEIGFEIEPFGGTDFAIKAVPSILGRARVEPLLRDALDEMAGVGHSGRIEQAVDAILLRMACHGSVRAGQTLGRDEAHALFEQLDRVEFGGNCPHGRPVWFRMGLDELEKRFDRR